MTRQSRAVHRGAGGEFRGVVFTVMNAAFVLGMIGVGIWAAFPIYQDAFYLITVGGAVVVGTAVAAVGLSRSWSWFTLLMVTVGSYLVLGVPLAVPTALTSVPAFGSGFLKLLGATALSWKELVTISIPVGTYQTMLVPAFILVLAVTTAALSLAWRSRSLYLLAIPLTFIFQLFGLTFGSSRTSVPIQLGPVNIPAPAKA